MKKFFYKIAYKIIVGYVGKKRELWDIKEIDNLYEIEDFLANIGEHHRAGRVKAARCMFKYLLYEYQKTGTHGDHN